MVNNDTRKQWTLQRCLEQKVNRFQERPFQMATIAAQVKKMTVLSGSLKS